MHSASVVMLKEKRKEKENVGFSAIMTGAS